MRFLLCFVLLQGGILAASYAQLSSLVTQTPLSSGATNVKLDVIDEIKDIELSEDREQIKINEGGLYFIIAAGQVGASMTGAKGFVDLWLAKNDKDIPNSNTRESVADSLDTGVLISQSCLRLEKGDRICIRYSATSASLGLIYSHPDNEPAIPSLIFTMIKIE